MTYIKKGGRMKSVLTTILSDQNSRDSRTVEQLLSTSVEAGVPWFNKAD